MDIDDELFSFSDSDKPSSPERKLKRLKKATEHNKDTIPDPLIDDATLNLFESETVGDFDNVDNGIESGLGVKRTLGSDDVDEGNELDSGLEGLVVKRASNFDDVDEEGEIRRPSFDGLEEEKKNKKRRVKNVDDNKTHLASSNKRKEEKERRDRLQELRAESQRLLRETRGASFKPVPIVQKPVSSILEKIRQRKREVSNRSVVADRSSSFEENDLVREVVLDVDFETSPSHDADPNGMEKENIADLAHAESSSDTEVSDDTAMHGPKCASDSNTQQAFRAPVDDTQDLIFDSQQSDSKNGGSDETPSSPLEEILAPSLLAMNLKFDSAPLDDFSSDEEDSNKENIDPVVQGSIPGDPVKAFVDEEAEEEDDSDNDLGRFQENEEEEDNIDTDELNDIIATECNEKPVDHEMRNELHQKWLEQQDNAGTENLLQKLKCGSVLRERNLCEEEEESEDEKDENEENETVDYHVSSNVVRMNLKKAKEMIPLMFTDKDDAYVSSDDEMTEKRLGTRYIPSKVGEQAKFLSPAEDEGSREIFGLIKKLNGVPDTRKKPKITSSFNMLSVGTKSNAPSMSSFLGRGSKNSLPSIQKHGSGTARAFIFERDDSNSRSAIPMPEDTIEVKETRPRKASAKFTSQNRSSSQVTQTVTETKSGPSLHDILRCPSLQSSNNTRNGTVSQVEAIYASFRLEQNAIKKERNVSIKI